MQDGGRVRGLLQDESLPQEYSIYISTGENKSYLRTN